MNDSINVNAIAQENMFARPLLASCFSNVVFHNSLFVSVNSLVFLFTLLSIYVYSNSFDRFYQPQWFQHRSHESL